MRIAADHQLIPPTLLGWRLVQAHSALLEAINDLEATLHKSARLPGDQIGDWRKAAIDLRRRIAEHRTTIIALADATLADSPLQLSFRSQFSRLCAAIAFHQASWPVVSIDLENTDYLASISEVRVAYASFFQWSRQTFSAR